MNVEIRVYNRSLELQGIMDEFSSLIWIRRYQYPGEFELRTPYAAESKNLLIPENIIQKYDGNDVVDAGVIENIIMTTDEIIVKGRFLESYLERRLIKATTYYDGPAEDSMRGIVSDMVEIPLLGLGTDHGLTEELDFQATYKTVLNIISKACRATGLGFRIRPDFETRDLYFEVYKGVDRTASAAAKVIFSEKYDNLLNEQYSYDSTGYRTKAYVTQLINDVRVAYSTGGGTGLGLREVHVPTTVDTNSQTSTQIKNAMIRQGKRALEAKTIVEGFTFSTDADAPFVYRSDYDLGDIAHVNHVAWNINLALRISEIEEDYENGGREIVLTCGSTQPETLDFEEG